VKGTTPQAGAPAPTTCSPLLRHAVITKAGCAPVLYTDARSQMKDPQSRRGAHSGRRAGRLVRASSCAPRAAGARFAPDPEAARTGLDVQRHRADRSRPKRPGQKRAMQATLGILACGISGALGRSPPEIRDRSHDDARSIAWSSRLSWESPRRSSHPRIHVTSGRRSWHAGDRALVYLFGSEHGSAKTWSPDAGTARSPDDGRVFSLSGSGLQFPTHPHRARG
jgi:hypothetical protein